MLYAKTLENTTKGASNLHFLNSSLPLDKYMLNGSNSYTKTMCKICKIGQRHNHCMKNVQMLSFCSPH